MEQKEALLALASTPHRRAEVSYYLGIKALSERRYRDASDWLRVTVETQMVRDWEFLWAKDLLTRWTGAGRELVVAVPRVAAKPPNRESLTRSPRVRYPLIALYKATVVGGREPSC